MYSQPDLDDLYETTFILLENYMHLNVGHYIQPGFHAMVVKDMTDLLLMTLSPCADNELDDLITPLVEERLALFYRFIAPARSSGDTFIRVKPSIDIMRKKIEYLQSVPQPEQRTNEWYEFRAKHLTASNIWKAFISESTRNQLILEKCQPVNLIKFGNTSLDSPMHWGQKYEPLSVMLYEHIYQTKISDFGCIPHRTIKFLAASPDGIVTNADSLRYGRMLEVKNIVNREITGIPKMEYWVQMQLQMEVCELNECDFLETRFTEYLSKEEYEEDMETKYKGMLMLFMSASGKPVYEFAPLASEAGTNASEAGTNASEAGTSEAQAEDTWQDAMMEKHQTLTWIKNIYWKLDEFSCVLVLRNKFWFASALPQLEEVWATIEREKEHGYSHREPKKMTKVKKLNTNEEVMPQQCFINTDNL